MKEVKTGLVLEGGAMRGMYTAGILDVLMEEKIQVDGVIGVSAGAVFGCNYKSGQIGRTLRYNMKFCGDKRYGTLHSLLKTGDIYDVDLCYHQIPEILDPFDNEAFAQMWKQERLSITSAQIAAEMILSGCRHLHQCRLYQRW